MQKEVFTSAFQKWKMKGREAKGFACVGVRQCNWDLNSKPPSENCYLWPGGEIMYILIFTVLSVFSYF